MIMKKIFTFAMAIVAAMTVSAKQQLDLTALPNGWGSSYDAVTKTITYEADAWGGRGWGFSSVVDGKINVVAVPADYDYVIVETEASKLKATLVVEYTDGTTVGANGNITPSSKKESVADAGLPALIAIPLDKTQVGLSQIYIQNSTWQQATPNNPVGTITIKDAYFATEAEYTAAKEAFANQEKTLNIGTKAGTTVEMAGKDFGWYSDWLGKDVTEFTTLVFEIGEVTGHGQITLQGTPTPDPASIDLPATTTAKAYCVDITNVTTLSQYAFQNVNADKAPAGVTGDASKEYIEPSSVQVLRVYLSNKPAAEVQPVAQAEAEKLMGGTSGVENVTVAKTAANADAPMYNLAGQRVGKNYHGVVIQNGRKFVNK